MPIPDKLLVEMALAKNFITAAQANKLQDWQRQASRQNIPLGVWLVKNGQLKTDQLARLQQEYKAISQKQSSQATIKYQASSALEDMPTQPIPVDLQAPTINLSEGANMAAQSLAIPPSLQEQGETIPLSAQQDTTVPLPTVLDVTPAETIDEASAEQTYDMRPKPSSMAQTVDAEALAETQPSSRDATGEIPQHFGRYKIIRELGKGNMGRVFQVYDPELNREIALKVMLAGEMADAAAVERFRREAQAAARLRHPNIIGVYDIGQHNNIPYFTMDLVKGKSLEKIMSSERKLSSRKIALLIKQVAQILHYAHTNNIVHRDLKPSNIMIGDNNEPYLMDFGLAKAIRGGSRLSRSGVIMGTPSYMPPEQAQGKSKEIDERSDIYALGATLYEMITGQVPFPGSDVFRVLMDVVNKPPVAPHEICPQVPADLENICLKCLSKDKKLRYATAKELAEDLNRFVEGEAVKATRQDFSIREWAIKHRGVVGTVCVSTLFIIAVVIHTIAQNNKLKTEKESKEIVISELNKTLKKLSDANKNLVTEKESKEIALKEKEKAYQIAEKSYQQTKDLLMATKWLNLLNQNILPEEINNAAKIEQAFNQLAICNSEVYFTWGKSYYAIVRNSDNQQERQTYLNLVFEKCEKAVEMDPENYGAALFGYNIASAHIPEITKRDSILNKFLGFFPQQGENCYSYFRKACQASTKEDALFFIQKAIDLNQFFFEAYVKKGDIYRKLRIYDEAEKAYKKAVELRPSDAYARLHLSRNFFEKGMGSRQNVDTSLRYFRLAYDEATIATEREPDWADPYCDLAEINLELGKLLTDERQFYWDQALQNSEKVLQKGGNIERSYKTQESIYVNWAVIHKKAGNYKESIKAYQKAINSIELILKLKTSSKESTFYSLSLQAYQKEVDALLQKIKK